MCIAVPSRITAIDGLTAVIEVTGARREVNLVLLSEEVKIGDYVLVHAGFAIQTIDPAEEADSLELFNQLVEPGISEE